MKEADSRSTAVRVSQREREVLALVAQGLSNKAIARALVLSELTVRNYVSRLMSKFHAHNRAELAVRWAIMVERRHSHHRFA